MFTRISFLPIIFFLLITAGLWGQYPALDPMLNFRDVAQLHQTGFKDLTVTVRGNSVHPPLLNLLISAGFSFFGKSPFSYNLIGFILFVLCVFSFYKFTSKSFGYWIANISTMLLFCNPMVITNFFNPSYEINTFIGLILLVKFYTANSLIPLAIVLAFFPLMKETAISIPLLFLIWQLITIIKRIRKHKKISQKILLKEIKKLWIFIPFFTVWLGWLLVSKINHLIAWQDTYFPHKGTSYQIIFDNIFKLKIFNLYFKSNLFNLFIFNFQWVYLALTIICLILIKRKKIPTPLIIFGFLSLSYGLLVLGFPTWTIPRYPLPIYPFLFVFLSFLLSEIRLNWLKYFLVTLALTTTLISNFGSFDPITKKFFPGEKNLYSTKFYDLPFSPYSLDSVNYNREFLKAVKNQNIVIQKILFTDPEIVVTNCNDFKLGEKLWTIYLTKDYSPNIKMTHYIQCLNAWDLGIHKNEILNAKILYLPNL